jgi:septum formation protein
MIRLGSNSITRATILKNHNIDFVQNGGSFDEDALDILDPREFVIAATKGKFKELFEKYGCDEMPLLVADTVVTCEGKLLRKAKDKNDAKAMLELQSNNKTTVISCMIFQSQDTYLFDVSHATYLFSAFDKIHMQEYVQSGECMGKAGAIMVEGFCKPYIKSVEGYESTAMGLCVEKLLPFIKK